MELSTIDPLVAKLNNIELQHEAYYYVISNSVPQIARWDGVRRVWVLSHNRAVSTHLLDDVVCRVPTLLEFNDIQEKLRRLKSDVRHYRTLYEQTQEDEDDK